MDEEFSNYQKPLDAMATVPTPVTMPDLPSLATTPFDSGLKRSRALPTEGEGEFEDTRASGSGTHHEANASGPADPTLPPPQGPTGQEHDVVPPEVYRTNVVAAFMGSPFLPKPNQLRADHIANLLAHGVDGPVQKVAFKLLATAYSQQEAKAIWTAWAPHLAPPLTTSLAGCTLLRDTVLQALCTHYPTTKHSNEAACKLVNDLAAAVATHTFAVHTAADL